MESPLNTSLVCSALLILLLLTTSKCNAGNSKLFREYIGADSDSVKLSDLPINSDVQFHFILAFAIDYTNDGNSPSPNNGQFNVFWATDHLTPGAIASIRDSHRNVKIAVSLGGDSVGSGNSKANFAPKSIDSWVHNAVTSLTNIIQTYHIDGIDVDYEHFKTDPDTFAECIGQLIATLKKSGTISFASIAPFEGIQTHYLALWKKYGHAIDYVNFQFYAYDKGTTVSQFMQFYKEQASNYEGGEILASFATDGTSGGLGPENGFFDACNELKSQDKLGGIFVWSADDSRKQGFRYEKKSQELLASS